MSQRSSESANVSRLSTDFSFGERAIRDVAAQLDQAHWPNALSGFRWFGDKGRPIASVSSRIAAAIPSANHWIAMLLIDVEFQSGLASTWFVPIVFESKPSVPAQFVVTDAEGNKWFGSDGAAHPVFQSWMLESAKTGATLAFDQSDLRWHSSDAARDLPTIPGRLLSGEQSNSSIVYGDQAIIKVMRRVVNGLNPDVELGRFLTEVAQVEHVPTLLADLSLATDQGESSLAIAQAFVSGSTDGWTWFLDRLKRAHDNPGQQAQLIDAVHSLGVSTAELHQAFASAEEPGIAAEPISADDLTAWTRGTLQLMDTVGDALAQLAVGTRDQDQLAVLEAALQAWPLIGVGVVGHEASSGLPKIRVHGDFHLGQTLVLSDRWRIIDFEGEPARSLDERRARFSPLKDVAGMLRSIDYGKAMMVREERGWLDESNALNDAFIAGYRGAITRPGLVPATDEAFADALKPWVIDKAMYEILYELNNRPDWLVVPIAALLRYLFMGDLGDYVAERTDDEP